MFPLFAMFRRIAKPTSFPPPFSPSPKTSSFWGISIAITPCGTHGEEVFGWIVFSDLLPFNDPDTPTLLGCSSCSHSLLTSPLLSPLLHLGGASGQALVAFQFFQLFPFLRSSAQINGFLPTIFRKLVGMPLLFILTFTVDLERNTLFCCCSLYFSGIKCGQIFLSFGLGQRQSQA